ncbi:MAG: Gfo/Idh/MocA family oxidoreductase [Saprospiraceae bacterium]|nr:Gfo/Idh/MocA family oxidoreductase [Saprospiraceae bacterium]
MSRLINYRRDFIKQSGLLFATGILPYNYLKQRGRSLGVALVGLGYYSGDLLAPALQATMHCHLAGIVTGSPDKIPVWQKKYGIPDRNVYNYENMDQIADNDAIDVIYIVLPTGLHAEYAIKAAAIGKHVWCEKPMARTAVECQAIIDACRKNKVKLSIGYRMQHEPNTQTVIKYAKSKPYGKILEIMAEAGYREGRTDHWKQNKALGGGAMYDMGVYPLNAIRYTSGEEPVAVTARHETTRPDIYHEVDEITYFDLEFASGVMGKGKTSFAESMNHLKATCENGWYELKPFQAYNGVKGITSDGIKLNASIDNQQAKQMDDDALAIINDTEVLVPGEDGKRDIAIVEAIYKSAAEGKRVDLT